MNQVDYCNFFGVFLSLTKENIGIHGKERASSNH
jgi:hypothetical protein